MIFAVMGNRKMAKHIDSEAFLKAINTLMYKDTTGYLDASIYNGAINDVADILEHFPAADVAEVVRCKDCIYHTEDDECTNGRWDNWSNSNDCELYPEALEMDHCSYGVRKNG